MINLELKRDATGTPDPDLRRVRYCLRVLDDLRSAPQDEAYESMDALRRTGTLRDVLESWARMRAVIEQELAIFRATASADCLCHGSEAHPCLACRLRKGITPL